MTRHAMIVTTLLTGMATAAFAGEIGYIEDFALAKDRTIALQQLIPGTEDFYYYHCLHFQNTEQFDRVEPLLKVWIKRHNYTDRVHEIQHRQALLTYDLHPQETLDYLKKTLNLRFDHQKETLGTRPDLPTELDASTISRETLKSEALRRYKNLNGFEDRALDWLVDVRLSPDPLRDLLKRLRRPDYGNLVELVLNDLSYKGSGGFGSLPVHSCLLLRQLDECKQRRPGLLSNSRFIDIYLAKLAPSDDCDWRHDVQQQTDYLERLWKFVGQLAPTFNSLKAHVLYHRLVLDRSQGIYDHPRFMTYIQLPRAANYANRDYWNQLPQRSFATDLSADFQPVTHLPVVGDDEPLIRSYLQHFFLTETTFKQYQPFLNDNYLKEAFAETKILHGLGDTEQWSVMLSPEAYQALKQRVDLYFAFTNKQTFSEEDPVRLDVLVKNVPTLIIKVYEINTYNYYRQNLREVNTDINLDGLVANQEQTHHFEDPSVRRVARHFEFPDLSRNGVYVIDFIGNGKSSRALIRKGRLHCLARTSTAGQLCTVWNQKNQRLSNASLLLDGHEYRAGEDGTITIPFSTRPGRHPVVLTHNGFSSLDTIQHDAESYQLSAGMYVDREALLSRKTAQLLVRPALYLNGTPVTLTVLENVRLVITSTDSDGIATSKEVADFKLSEDRESVYEFQVPQRLSQVTFQLKAQVKSFTLNKKLDLATQETFQLNGIAKTEKTEDLHLTNFGGGYLLELLGKSGEPKPRRPILVTLKHRDFRNPVKVTLQSDGEGRVSLGQLREIEQVTAVGPQDAPATWHLGDDRHSYYGTLQGREDSPIELPFMANGEEMTRSAVSLLELRRNHFVADRFDAARLHEGMLSVAGLPRGDYDLLLKRSGTRIRLRIAAGELHDGYVLGTHRQLELRGTSPLQIKSVVIGEDQVEVHLDNSSKFTRVHVFATRYQPAYSAFNYLGSIRDCEPSYVVLGSDRSSYVAGRKLGDEYRYIIDRKYAKKFAGNMLTRPSLLLNPWPIRKTEAGKQDAKSGEAFAESAPEPSSRSGRGKNGKAKTDLPGDFADLDFLANGSAVLLNLAPDDAGLVTLDRKDLAAYQYVRIVAIDPDDTSCRTVNLTEAPRQFVDRRLKNGLDPTEHFTQQKKVSVVQPGAEFHLDDITAARFESYDSLARVHSLLVTLSNDATLVEFAFILKWDQMAPEEKKSKYSKYACHELNYFLFRKDAVFFKQVVLPHLLNKKDKTFLDEWLIAGDLTAYLRPWSYARLNVVERILLAQRIAGEQPKTSRLVRDMFNVLPPDVDRFNFLFDTALKGSSLDKDDRLGLKRAAGSVRLGAAMDSPMPPPASAAGAPGGGRRKTKVPALKEMEEADALENSPEERNLARRGRALKSKSRLSEEKSKDADDRHYFRNDGKLQEELRRLYVKMDKTQEWAENNYYRLPIEQQNGDLIKVNAFWKDYAEHDFTRPFQSVNFAQASQRFSEMMFVLAVLDLPFQSGEHKTTFDEASMTLVPSTPMIAFHEEIRKATKPQVETPILVSQNFFRHGDRYQYLDNQRIDKYVSDEFLVHTVYGCQIVVTNPTSTPQELELLTQIPVGAMPVSNGRVTRSTHIDLQPFHTTTIEYSFYFPHAGQFAHYPVHISRGQQLLAFADAVTLNAVDELSHIDRTSWDYLSQFGTDQQVLDFLRTNNLKRITLEKIAFRMQDPVFFQNAIQLLTDYHVYDQTLWSYGIKHNATSTIQQYLQHLDDFVAKCGLQLNSPLLTIDPVARGSYQHLDYRPFVNARAHQLGTRRQIVNERLLQQYQQLLRIVGSQRQLTDEQRLAVTYYLLLQDRVEEALECFKSVKAESLPTRLQYDYLTAYLDFYADQLSVAEEIAERYTDYPVDRWRKAFAAIRQQVDEIHGKQNAVVDPEDRGQTQTGLASTDPSFNFTVDARQVTVKFQNLKKIRVNYYLMDIELLFSRNPFVQRYSGQFSFIRPNISTEINLPTDSDSTQFELPKALQSGNVLVEIRGGGQTKSQAYYANSLSVQVIENYGQLQVTHESTSDPLSKVYVKVYSRMKDGNVRFYKDGYTDLRGRFDYSSLNTNELDVVEKFSLLIFSEQHGAVVREASPPKR